jgi:hypothetical protein
MTYVASTGMADVKTCGLLTHQTPRCVWPDIGLLSTLVEPLLGDRVNADVKTVRPCGGNFWAKRATYNRLTCLEFYE